MYTHIVGDIFTTSLPAIAHGVNTKGLMGAGIARLIAERYPEVVKPYKQACQDGSLLPGGFLYTPTLTPGFGIMNLASQNNPGKDARMEWLESSLWEAVRFAEETEMPGFAIPRIGAGIGGLEWVDVQELIRNVGDQTPLLVENWSLPDA